MEECKCGRIPSCYSGRVFNIYEEAKKVKEEWDKTQELWGAVIDKMRAKLMEGGFFDDTYHKVYGVNEQLCDLGKTILTKNKDIMEEKKTKKMTKAEAFEWLNNKKLTAKDNVYVNVLFKLFECGIEWVVGGQSFTYYGSDFLIIEGGKLFHCGNDGENYWRSHHFEEVSADDILSIEIVEEKKVLSVDCALEHAKWIMKYLREECSPHTKMIIEGDHAELVEGVKSVVWKDDME